MIVVRWIVCGAVLSNVQNKAIKGPLPEGGQLKRDDAATMFMLCSPIFYCRMDGC